MHTSITSCCKFWKRNYFHLKDFNATGLCLAISTTTRSCFKLLHKSSAIIAMLSRNFFRTQSKIEKILREEKVPYPLSSKYFKRCRWWSKNLPEGIQNRMLQNIDEDPAEPRRNKQNKNITKENRGNNTREKQMNSLLANLVINILNHHKGEKYSIQFESITLNSLATQFELNKPWYKGRLWQEPSWST